MIRCFMGRHLLVARQLHLGARRRERCRSGPILCRRRVRYVPSVQCPPLPPAHLPSPVRRDPPRCSRVGPVGPPVCLAPPLVRARGAARAHRRARPAQHEHPHAPTTPTEPTFHAPLLLGAAGRAPTTAARCHAAARVHAPAAKARVVRPGPSPSPSRRSTSAPSGRCSACLEPPTPATLLPRSSTAPTSFQSPPLAPPSVHLHR
jgi:hypothetical protein